MGDHPDSPEFKRWFSGSRVVHDDGSPMVVYHGTNGNDFRSFDVSPRHQLGAKDSRIAGAWFSSDRSMAEDYANNKYRKNNQGKVIPAYLNIRNPHETTLREVGDYKKYIDGMTPERIEHLKSLGHDGAFFHFDEEGPFSTKQRMGEIVAFDPRQVKHATENEGSFEPNNSDMFKAAGGAIEKALRIARAEGGGIHLPHKLKLHVGPIHSRVAGRTDHLPVHVPSGAYVLPADIVSAMGEGNTSAGFEHIKRMFGGLPYKARGSIPYAGGEGPYGSDLPRAYGGSTPAGSPVACVLAGGEYVLSPEQVTAAGDGDMDTGHHVLDGFVKKYRAKTVKTLKGLPGPKRD